MQIKQLYINFLRHIASIHLFSMTLQEFLDKKLPKPLACIYTEMKCLNFLSASAVTTAWFEHNVTRQVQKVSLSEVSAE